MCACVLFDAPSLALSQCVFMFVMHINTIVTFLIILSESNISKWQDTFCIRIFVPYVDVHINTSRCLLALDGFKNVFLSLSLSVSLVVSCLDTYVTLKEIISLLKHHFALTCAFSGFRLVICNISRMV